jgi:hypothetical protein
MTRFTLIAHIGLTDHAHTGCDKATADTIIFGWQQLGCVDYLIEEEPQLEQLLTPMVPASS